MDDPELDDGQLETGHHLRELTDRRRADAGGPENIAARVRKILDYISKVGLDLPIFLDAVCWGNNHLAVDGKAKYERSVLMHSSELPRILERWGGKSSPAKLAVKNYALSTIKTAINGEMDSAVSELTVTGEEIEEENLLSITQEDMVKRLKPVTGTLWEILGSSVTRKDKSRNKHIHDPEKV
jgi:hypothetical protein